MLHFLAREVARQQGGAAAASLVAALPSAAPAAALCLDNLRAEAQALVAEVACWQPAAPGDGPTLAARVRLASQQLDDAEAAFRCEA